VVEPDRRAATAVGDLPCRVLGARAQRNRSEKLAVGIRQVITSGERAPGAKRPTRVEPAKRHDVSAGTINGAIAVLNQAGPVTTASGGEPPWRPR